MVGTTDWKNRRLRHLLSQARLSFVVRWNAKIPSEGRYYLMSARMSQIHVRSSVGRRGRLYPKSGHASLLTLPPSPSSLNVKISPDRPGQRVPGIRRPRGRKRGCEPWCASDKGKGDSGDEERKNVCEPSAKNNKGLNLSTLANQQSTA